MNLGVRKKLSKDLRLEHEMREHIMCKSHTIIKFHNDDKIMCKNLNYFPVFEVMFKLKRDFVDHVSFKSVCCGGKTKQQWNWRRFQAFQRWGKKLRVILFQSSFDAIRFIVGSVSFLPLPPFHLRFRFQHPSPMKKHLIFIPIVIKNKTKFDPYSVYWVHLSWILWNEMMVMIGMYLAFLQHLFRNESIEICITFQVPLILHLEIGARWPSAVYRTFSIKIFWCRKSPLNCNWSQIDDSVSIIIIIKWSDDVISSII